MAERLHLLWRSWRPRPETYITKYTNSDQVYSYLSICTYTQKSNLRNLMWLIHFVGCALENFWVKVDNFCFCIIIVVKVNDSNKSFSGEMIASVRRKHSKYSQVLLKRKRFFFFTLLYNQLLKVTKSLENPQWSGPEVCDQAHSDLIGCSLP